MALKVYSFQVLKHLSTSIRNKISLVLRHDFYISWHANSTEDAVASSSGSRRGNSRRRDLSQDAQRVKNHMVIFPYYHKQLIFFEGTHFACRHHSPGL